MNALKSSVSLIALRVAMPPRDLKREAELTQRARQMVEEARLAVSVGWPHRYDGKGVANG